MAVRDGRAMAVCDGCAMAVCDGCAMAVCDGRAMAVCDGCAMAVCDGCAMAVCDGCAAGGFAVQDVEVVRARVARHGAGDERGGAAGPKEAAQGPPIPTQH